MNTETTPSLKTIVINNIAKILPIELAAAIIGAPLAHLPKLELELVLNICMVLDDLGDEALDDEGEPVYAMEDIQAMAHMLILAANMAALEVMLENPQTFEDTIGPTVGTA